MVDDEELNLETLLKAIHNSLICPVCSSIGNNLRVLPDCKHLMCSRCLEDKYKREQQRHGVKCPVCLVTLTRQPADCTPSKLAGYIFNYSRELEVIINERKGGECESRNCTKKSSVLCHFCHKLLCVRCGSRRCLTSTDMHKTKGLADCEAAIHENFSLWQKAKNKAIEGLKEQKKVACAEVRLCGDQLCSAPTQSLRQVIGQVIPRLQTAQQNILELEMLIEEDESALNFVVKIAQHVQEKPLIRLLNALLFYEKRRTVQLGSYEMLIEGVDCFDVSDTSRGQLLIARKGGVEVFDPKEKCQIQFLQFQLYVFTVETYEDMVVLGVRVSDIKKEMVVLNASYKQLRKWEIPEETLDFTVVNDIAFLSVAAKDCSIKAYDLHTGERKSQADILWNGRIAGVTRIPPSSIVFDDRTQNTVYKQCVTSGKRRNDWSTKVSAPHCVCADENGLIWVRSNQNNSLTILNQDGTPHQDSILDDRLNEFGAVNDICVYKHCLYVAHEKGLGRFHINYIQN